MGIREDSWLSGRFGHPVFTVDDPSALPGHAAGRSAPATYQARVDTADADAVAAFEAAGMRVVCTSVTLSCDPATPVPGGEDVQVRSVVPDRDGVLLDLAGRSFAFSRFHLDPEVPDEVANRVKRDWVWSYLNGTRGEELLVAVSGGLPVGFLAVIAAKGRPVRVIDLVAVAPEARGSGAGRALVRAFHEGSAGRCEAVEVGTQVENVPAVRFYEGLGYVSVRSAYDLHMHLA